MVRRVGCLGDLPKPLEITCYPVIRHEDGSLVILYVSMDPSTEAWSHDRHVRSIDNLLVCLVEAMKFGYMFTP